MDPSFYYAFLRLYLNFFFGWDVIFFGRASTVGARTVAICWGLRQRPRPTFEATAPTLGWTRSLEADLLRTKIRRKTNIKKFSKQGPIFIALLICVHFYAYYSRRTILLSVSVFHRIASNLGSLHIHNGLFCYVIQFHTVSTARMW